MIEPNLRYNIHINRISNSAAVLVTPRAMSKPSLEAHYVYFTSQFAIGRNRSIRASVGISADGRVCRRVQAVPRSLAQEPTPKSSSQFARISSASPRLGVYAQPRQQIQGLLVRAAKRGMRILRNVSIWTLSHRSHHSANQGWNEQPQQPLRMLSDMQRSQGNKVAALDFSVRQTYKSIGWINLENLNAFSMCTGIV